MTIHVGHRRPLAAARLAAAHVALLALFALALLASATGCGEGAQVEAATPTVAPPDTASLSAEAARLAGLAIAPAESSAWRDGWAAPARLTLDPAQTARLGAIAEGRVTRVPARVGDRVRAGQVLVAIHSHELTDALSALAKATAGDVEAAAALVLAESAAARAERLHALRALSLAEVERARGALAVARSARAQGRAELERARAMRDHLVGGAPAAGGGADAHEVLVRSPLDGVVVARDAQPGAVVLVGAPLVTVSRATSLLLDTRVPERALGAAVPGAEVRFIVPAFPDARFTARVTRVAPTLDSATRTVAVEAVVLDGVGRLRAEMYATAELIGAPGTPTLSVPAAAVQSLDGDTVVLVARPRGGGLALEAVRVRVGRRTAERAEILGGLAPGTPVVTAGAAVAKAELLRRRGGE